MLQKLRFFVFALLLGSRSFGMGNPGDWLLSGGFGLTFSPTAVLLMPQMEYVYQNNVYLGPLFQVAPGDANTIFMMSASARVVLGNHPRIKPNVDGGLGLAVIGNQPGILIHVGMGVDYLIDRGISVGTVITANFAPPADPFILSWPLVVGRFVL